MGPEYARYRVKFHVRGRIKQHHRIVSLYEGYSGWDDIPLILAVAEGTEPDKIVINELSTALIATTDFDAAMSQEGRSVHRK